MMSSMRFAKFTGLAETAKIRVAKLHGQDHLVVPVVAMMGNSIVSGMNSKGPEFVPAEVLEAYPSTWNGRPLVTDHPTDDTGEPISANTPEVLDSTAFGYMLNTRFEDGRLRTDAYINVAAAEAVGELGVSILKRIEKGEPIEVSVGAYVYLEEVEGEFEGTPYSYKWRDYFTDHLALLPEGVRGACSNKMGCGAPRVMKEATMPEVTKQPNFFIRMLSALIPGFRADEYSDRELRNSLWDSLRGTVPAFDSVVEVYADSRRVIYSTYLDGKMSMFEATYEEKEGKFVFSEGVEVKPSMNYVPVAKAAVVVSANAGVQETTEPALVVRAASCGCGGHVQESATEAQKGTAMSQQVKDAAGRLIANERSPYTAQHQGFLESLSVDEITAIAKPYEEAAPVPTPSVNAAPATPLSMEAFLATAPKEFRDVVVRSLAHEAAHRRGLIDGLAAAQTEYDVAKLEGFSTCQLESFSRMLKVGEEAPSYGFAAGNLAAGATKVNNDVNQALKDPQGYTAALSRKAN